MIQSRTGIGPKYLFGFVVLSGVLLHGAASTVLSVPVDEVSCLVDHSGGILKKNLTGQHRDTVRQVGRANEFRQPAWFGNRVAVEQGDPFTLCFFECKIV